MTSTSVEILHCYKQTMYMLVMHVNFSGHHACIGCGRPRLHSMQHGK